MSTFSFMTPSPVLPDTRQELDEKTAPIRAVGWLKS